MHGSTANKVEFVIGINDIPVRATQTQMHGSEDGDSSSISIGLDSVSAPTQHVADMWNSTDELEVTNTAKYNGFPGIGYHYLAAIEYSDAALTFTVDEHHLFEGEIYG